MKQTTDIQNENKGEIEEIVTIELLTGNREEALRQYCTKVLGTGDDVSLNRLEDLPPLPAPSHIQKQYLEGIFKMADYIMKYGKVEMPRELYDIFRRCAEIQGTILEKIVATIIFQRGHGESVEITRFL